MMTKETSRLSAPGYALRSKAAEKTKKTGKESTLKNTVSCVDNPVHFIHVEDLCTSIIVSAKHSDTDAVNTEFNIGAKVYSTMREDYQVVLDKAGYGKKIKESPAHLVICALEVLEFLNLSPLYPWVYKTATKDSFVSIDKAEKIIGFTPEYSNKDALLRNYQWYLDNRTKLEKGDGVTHRVPWSQGVLSLVRHFF